MWFLGLSKFKQSLVSYLTQSFRTLKRQLLKATRSLTTVPLEVDFVLSKTLEERNFLIHSFFREHAGDIINDKGKALMIDRLRSMIELFQHADSLVTPIYMTLWGKYGVDESFIQRELADMEAEIEAKYSGL